MTDYRRDGGATFTYVHGTSGGRASWPHVLPVGVVIAATPGQHDAMALALVRLVIEAVENNRPPPVPFYRNTLKCLRDMEEIIVAAHTSISTHLVPPNFRLWAGNIKRMLDRPDAANIAGIVADAMRQSYDHRADLDKLFTTFALIYGD